VQQDRAAYAQPTGLLPLTGNLLPSDVLLFVMC
jgi:hypothetical protein